MSTTNPTTPTCPDLVMLINAAQNWRRMDDADRQVFGGAGPIARITEVTVGGRTAVLVASRVRGRGGAGWWQVEGIDDEGGSVGQLRLPGFMA